MTKSPLKLVPPATVKRTVAAPGRKANAEYRRREHLTVAEIGKLMKAASGNRYGHRDATMIWSPTATACEPPSWSTCAGIRSISPGHPARSPHQERHAGTHPIVGDEMRALRRLQREQDPQSPFVFTSERGSAIHHGGLCPAWSSALARRPSSAFRLTRTCCATPAASRSPRRATTRGRYPKLPGPQKYPAHSTLHGHAV